MRARALAGLSMALMAAGCGAVVPAGGEGACGAEHERCVAACRADLVDPRDCELSCDFDARLCDRRASAGRERANNVDRPGGRVELGPPETIAVDFRGGRIQAEGAFVTLKGAARPVDGAYEIGPGGTVRLVFPVPADAQAASLTLLHATGGDGVGCFITVAVGDQPLLGRYAPPRATKAGHLRPERWDVGFALDAAATEDADSPRKVTVFLYNNQAAGSRSPYLVGAAELTYRRPAPK